MHLDGRPTDFTSGDELRIEQSEVHLEVSVFRSKEQLAFSMTGEKEFILHRCGRDPADVVQFVALLLGMEYKTVKLDSVTKRVILF